jgi:hypothetical protein
MSVHSPDVGLILYLDVLAQSALPDKRPCHARNRVPMPKVRLWPILPRGDQRKPTHFGRSTCDLGKRGISKVRKEAAADRIHQELGRR